MGFRKYLILFCVMCFASTGDFFLALGMRKQGAVDLHHLPQLMADVLNPWVLLGIALLIGFFISYSTALSWADLSFVLPATAFGYVVVALLAKFFLHEYVSPLRWLGIALIVCGVGWVTRGPALTHLPSGGKQHESA